MHYTLIGMCFVNEKCIDYTQQLKEEVSKKIKHHPNSAADLSWSNMFVTYITTQANDVDLRLQKCLLKELQLMLDGGYGDLYILDSTRYRSLYIAKVYENTNKKLEEKEELELKFEIIKV